MTQTGSAPKVREATAVIRCVAEIRRMILDGKLLPGQKVHQGELAAHLRMSRIPVREALSTLQAEGVLNHKPNTGFTVARFSGEDLSEIYLMRRLLETELLRSIDLPTVDTDELRAVNGDLREIDPSEDPDEYQDTNHRFHFKLFEYSPLLLVRNEVSRLWYRSNFYRSLYLYESNVALQIDSDHDRIIEAVASNDLEQLIRASDEHRNATEHLIIQRLGRSRPRLSLERQQLSADETPSLLPASARLRPPSSV